MSTFDVKAELFEQLARIGKALGSAYRLQLLDLLAQGERSVDTLAQLCKLSITNASQHLQHLRRAGLVRARKEGLYVHYRLSGDSIVRLVAAMRAVGEEHVAEVDKLIKEYLNTKDELEPSRRANCWSAHETASLRYSTYARRRNIEQGICPGRSTSRCPTSRNE